MERQQQIAYQLDLFSEQERNGIDQTLSSQGVSGDMKSKVSQVTWAGQRGV